MEGLGLDGGGGNSGGGGIRDVMKAGGKVLYFCDFFIKVFDATFCLFNHIFLGFQILRHFGNYLEDPP